MVKKLDGIAVRIPGNNRHDSPPVDVFVNFRLVDSSNVDRVGWDRFGNTYVEFKNGGLYVYIGTTRQRAVATAYSPSVGSYVARRLKPQYNAVKIR